MPNDRDEVRRHFITLCEWAATLRLEDIPSDTLATAALILGDNLAAALSAENEPEIRAWHERAIAARTTQQSTIWRKCGPRTSLADAAVANGLAATWDELDDGYTRTAVHPGALSQPLILAAAEADHASLARMLRAVVGAYEIGTRFARTWPGTLPRIHPHGVYNAVCAAAGVALLRDATADELACALSSAVTMSSPGPYNHPIEGALVRNAWPAAGAWLGLFAWDLAKIGVGGMPTGPYDVYTTCLGAPALANELTVNLGGEWTIQDGYHKLYAACHHSHAAMEAIESILSERAELRGGAAIKRVVVEGSMMARNFANAQPETTLGAKFSIPHAIAGTIVHGAADPRVFATEGLRDAQIAAMRARVSLELLPDVKPWPYDRPARVTFHLDGGEQLVAECDAALGSPARPISAAQVIAKIERAVVYGPASD